MRRLPSNMNGLVTTPTVSAPSSFATRATTGARARAGAAAHAGGDEDHVGAGRDARGAARRPPARRACPTSGLAPAPSPCVSFSPSCSFTGARLARSACASVLAAMKSTPGRPGRDHRVDRVAAAAADADHLDAGALDLHHLAHRPPPPGARPRTPIATQLEELPQPTHHPVPRPLERTEPRPVFPRRRSCVPLEPVQHEADGCRIHRTRHDVNQSGEMERHSEAHRGAKHALREVRHAVAAPRRHRSARPRT